MDLQPIEVGWKEARATLAQYTAILKEKRTAEDIAIIKSTKAVLAGKTVIRLVDAVRVAGVDGNGMPTIAIARADDQFVKCKSRGQSCTMISAKRNEYVPDYHARRGSWDYRVNMPKPRGFRFSKLQGKFQDEREGTALVPTVPPALRPAPSSLADYYILFEPEWDVTPPVDPALLAPLGSGLFVVVAQWDLTEVERAVLAHARGV